MTEKKREKKTNKKKKIKSRPFAFHASEAPKRIRNNWALGILSSLAIRLSWWSERDEWQGSRPSLGFTQQGVFLPSSPLSSSPFRVAEMQLKYFQMKTMRFKVPNLNHGGWWDWRGVRGAKGHEQTRTQSHVRIVKPVHKETAQCVHETHLWI